MDKDISFRFAPDKAVAALHWMVEQKQGVDLHTVLKACYFADRASLAEIGRPIFGANYKAMRYGPVPLEIYEVAKGEPMWLAEVGLPQMPWTLEGYCLHLARNQQVDRDVLSDSDWRLLRQGFERAKAMTFTQRTAATHGPDWQAARLGRMRYEDMIPDDTPERDELIEDLRENGWRIAL